MHFSRNFLVNRSFYILGTLAVAGAAAEGDTYLGNGATGFGGPVGNGSLTVTNTVDSSGNPDVTFTFLGSAAHPTLDGNDLVIYLSTGAAGLSDTSTLTDHADGGREAVSGYNGDTSGDGGGPRSLVTFPTGFQATYAISVEDGFVGLFHLVGLNSPPSLDYVGQGSGNAVTESSDNGAAPYGDTITVPLSVIGVTPGQSFELVGTDDATSDYRSNETIGPSAVVLDPTNLGTAPNAGYTGSLDFTGYDTFSTPEPASGTIILAGAGAMALRRRRSIKTRPNI